MAADARLATIVPPVTWAEPLTASREALFRVSRPLLWLKLPVMLTVLASAIEPPLLTTLLAPTLIVSLSAILPASTTLPSVLVMVP